MKDVSTNIINMSQFLERTETTMLGTPEATCSIQINHLCKHARTMVMMYEATGDQRYLKQARLDLDLAQQIKVGFIRPLGVLKSEAA